ncbi:MAG: energy-coupling factor ABC transporter permease [Candidatus Omnitrophota bacterium]|nr:MAG: energy-coupling factor ABC transporter permease [Candidatus Omnitrophota bacterium]
MHIPNGMLQGGICPVTAVVSTIVIGFAAFRAFFAKNKPSAARFAAITALIFAGQMMNFPVSGGTSGHLLGGILAVALLGVPFGILSMALVVTIQCLIFSDGGFTVLGANILNMAIIGAGLGGFIYQSFAKKFSLKSSQYFVGISVVSWFSIMIAALACSIELAISGTTPFFKVIGAMLGTHAFIAIGEALITVAACFAFASELMGGSQKRSVTVPLIAAGIIAFVLSPFASGLPDGLEWVAAKFNFLHESVPTFVSPLPDYTVAAISNEPLATGLAGLIGVIITFFAAWIVANIFSRPTQLEVSA